MTASFAPSVRTARLASGLVLFGYVTTHLTNHALGLISLSAMEAGRDIFLAIWRSLPGTIALYGAVSVHFALALQAIYLRRSWRMPASELGQIILGLLIPLLLVEHVVSTRLLHGTTGIRDGYARVIYNLWVASPLNGLRQSLVVVVAWAHGCLGLHFWLRQRSWYAQRTPLFLAAAVSLPVLALLGFADAGQKISALSAAGKLGEEVTGIPLDAADAAFLEAVQIGVYAAFTGAIGGLISLRILRYLRQRRSMVEIRYAGGRAVRVPRGFSVLEASRYAGISHHSVCRGKGRCSTCRVRVMKGLESLPAAAPAERRTLTKINAGFDVRLACQLRPEHDLTVIPLLFSASAGTDVASRPNVEPGREQEVVVMFCDIRNFTHLVEARLPFDVVFLLNRYFAVVGQAVEAEGGRMDKFVGDGAIALFGVGSTTSDPCLRAFAAAASISDGIDQLNRELVDDLKIPLRVAIGVHVGPAVVGAIGYGPAVGMTAIGDTVNIASRLEASAKELDAYLVASEIAAQRAGLDLAGAVRRDLSVRGRSARLKAVVFSEAHGLAKTIGKGAA